MDRLEPAREVDPFDSAHQTYAHILVDEAQDITPMQWRMLRRRGASASWTDRRRPGAELLARPGRVSRAINEMVGRAPVRRFRMSTNYRSPSEVYDLAAKVVVQAYPGGRPAEGGPLDRHHARLQNRLGGATSSRPRSKRSVPFSGWSRAPSG